MEGALARSLATAAAAVMLPPPPAASSLRRRSSSRVAASGLRASVSASTATSSTSMVQLVAAGSGIDELRLVDERAAVAALQLLPVGGCEVEKLRAVAEAAADRAEMHDIIGRQRDNWNHLLLHSNNSLLLAASLMAALAPTAAPTVVALKASAGVLLASAAVTMAAVNKIQPSQLAEEQRNATRLWRQLERDVRATLALAAPVTRADVHDAMDRVLALDAAYPLPLLPVMLDKFPKAVEPARWWPPTKKHQQRSPTKVAATNGTACRRATSMAGNGWTQELEEEMRGILRVIKAKDENEYVSVGKLVLAVNKRLAVAGPALAGAAALAAAFIGSAGEAGAWASGAAVLGGALAAAVNTVEHGGQVGMVFELCRNVAGIYRKMQEDIEANLEEADVERRENGEVFETKVALQLGRSTSELRQFRAMASPAVKDEDIREFAGKLV
uniref:F-box protein n=1 Tax=Oryza rufipogon TaxID=4529 RepID=A0A0E0NBY6_ORYRU